MSNNQPQQVVVKDDLKDDPKWAKLVRVVEKLNKYLDFRPEFLDQFPENLPRKFELRIGANVVGFAVMNWRAVGGKLLDALTLKPKPDDLSEDEYFELLKEYFESLSPKEQLDLLLPSFTAMWHMLENMPEKLNDAIVHLAMEGRQTVIIKQQQDLGKSISSPSKFADELIKIERAAIKKRLPKLQPSKTKPAWKNESNLRRFAETVNMRQLLCQCMKNIYNRCDFLEDWAEDLRQDEQFQLLSTGLPPKAITWAIRQIGDDKIDARDKEALLLACEIARQELDFPFQEIQTLRGYYSEGSRLLREDRSKGKPLMTTNLSSAPSTSSVVGAESGPSTLQTDDTDSQ